MSKIMRTPIKVGVRTYAMCANGQTVYDNKNWWCQRRNVSNATCKWLVKPQFWRNSDFESPQQKKKDRWGEDIIFVISMRLSVFVNFESPRENNNNHNRTKVGIMIIQNWLKVTFEEAWNTDKIIWSFLIILDNLTLR